MRRNLFVICMIIIVIVMVFLAIALGITCLYFSTSKEYRRVMFKNKKKEYVSTNDDVLFFVEAYYDQTYQTRT
jgi:flagellar basal body-associated protein FliL